VLKDWLVLLLILLINPVFGKLDIQDTIPKYSFVRYDLNKISIKDSSTLAPFFEKVWEFESKGTGKARILQIGDSHIQAGYFSHQVRTCFHEGLGCGTRERGFVFPFGMAQTNGPLNFGAVYSGKWTGYKSASNRHAKNWGVSGITATTNDDTTTLKIYTNNRTYDAYQFDRVRLFFRDDFMAFKIKLRSELDSNIVATSDSLGCYLQYNLDHTADTIYFTFLKDSFAPELAEFELQGVELLNDKPGLTYSEIGVNGAKVKSFLRCVDFGTQLNTLNPDLIIISLGTNDGYNLGFKDTVFNQHYDSLIRVIKSTLPNASIILTTPGDFKRYRKRTVKENLLIRKTILALGEKYDCAVWDLFSVMGGLGSMKNWVNKSLASPDYIHFNADGYEFQGKLFFSAVAQLYAKHTKSRRTKPYILNEGVNYEKLITNIFFYNPKEPMIFSHYLFWAFFTVFFLLYAFVHKHLKIRSLYLFLFSLFFYYKAGGLYFFLLLFSTVIDYAIGYQIFKAKTKNKSKYWLWGSLTVNLLLLFFYKYSYFITDSLNYIFNLDLKAYNIFSEVGNMFSTGSFDINQIILPVGISFYTFQTMSYAIDIYRKKLEPVNSIIDFGFFVSFFPQLVAGPIVRASEFIPQIRKPYELTKSGFSKAGILIIGGLFKKMVISDYISVNYVDRIFESPLKYSGFENLMGSYGYAIQIYFDFSAYSDIAIGLALLLGFTLPDNFRKPYLSVNITDFWRRWHISLSRWLKDYLYISLGGNRKGKARTYINLFITMLLGGLWHGAALKFIIWGGLHGVALGFHKYISTKFPDFSTSQNIFYALLGWLVTFHFVVFCWIFFRASDMIVVKQVLYQIFFDFKANRIFEYITTPSYSIIYTVIISGYLIDSFPTKVNLQVQKIFSNKLWPSFGAFAVLMVIIIYQFKSADIQPFIYFQF
jgi:D-alanyl-lipoteichoic acid acyltransferase DltB (MBOAT superfamily)/lysophospholipase L1-like esterase